MITLIVLKFSLRKKNHALTVGWCWPMKSQTHKSSTNQLLETGWWLSPRFCLKVVFLTKIYNWGKMVLPIWECLFGGNCFNQNVSGEKMGMLFSEVFSAFGCIYLWACANFDGGPKKMSTINSHNFWSPIRVATPTHQPETSSQILGGFSGTEKLEKGFGVLFCSMFRWCLPRTRSRIPKMTWCRWLTATELKALPLQF